MIKICTRKECNNRFNATPKGQKKYCSLHKYSQAKYQAEYYQTPNGRAIKLKAMAKYHRSSKGKATKFRYKQSPKGKATTARVHKNYMPLWSQTPKGKAVRARSHIKRRKRSTNPDLYALRVLQLHQNREPCAICGTSYKRSHTIDHIIALCNEGRDEWSNYQPICKLCHKIKTKQDIQIYYGVYNG